MHWPEEQALKADVVYIENACIEHIDFLNLIHFGKSTKPGRAVIKRKPTASDWRAFVKRHNAARAGTRRN